ncbi:espin-like [Panicum miliaceum]|uniref:Espin-like n=1 Tax=Panicum miliaceum TaxID=4540 RepID=A0A3L6PKD9_PANMI|nr:espin-like [Panicum miliaceum]
MSAAAADAGGTGGCDDSPCSTPFVSAPSSPTRDRDAYLPHHAACFYSAPASPTRGGAKDFGAAAGLHDFDFDFSSRFPSPSAAAMSSADELFCNGQIRPVRLAAALLQPQQPRGGAKAAQGPGAAEEDGGGGIGAVPDERGRVRGRSVRRKARSMSPFRTHWRRSPAPAPQAPAPENEHAADEEQAASLTPAASRSSSSSSTASSASSSSSFRGSRRWGGFLKDLLHRSKSDGGKTHHHSHLPTGPAPPTSPSPAAAPKRSPSPSPSPSPAATTTRTSGHRGGRRRSAHERLYEARRAEAEEMRRRTNLPYRQGFLLFGCIGLGHRSYGAVHGLARGLNAAAAVSSRS